MSKEKPKCQGECGDSCPKQNQALVFKIIPSLEQLNHPAYIHKLTEQGVRNCPGCIASVLKQTSQQVKQNIL